MQREAEELRDLSQFGSKLAACKFAIQTSKIRVLNIRYLVQENKTSSASKLIDWEKTIFHKT